MPAGNTRFVKIYSNLEQGTIINFFEVTKWTISTWYRIYMTFTIQSRSLRQNICRLFHVLVQFLFTTSETKLDYYHQKINVQVRDASRVAEWLTTKNLWNAWIWWPVSSRLPKRQLLTFILQNYEISTVKYSIEKLILLNFVNLSKIFCLSSRFTFFRISSKHIYPTKPKP